MRISIIAAQAENGIIGRAGQLPWRLKADLQRFKKLTMGHTVIMGRKTWESIGRPLPGRQMIVVSRQLGYLAEGAEVVTSLDDALALAQAVGEDEAFVIGGAEIYRLALAKADRLYMTLVLAEVDGDTRFPEIDWDAWVIVDSESHDADAENEYLTQFCTFVRCAAEAPSN